MISQDSGGASEIIAPLRRALFQAWSDVLVQDRSPVALIDFPDYGNVGDSAIWLGERQLLRHFGTPVTYSCSEATYRPNIIAATLDGEGTILINGGGNFGDLWPQHQALREDIAHRFPHMRIVQLPQSIHFTSEANLRRAELTFAQHDNFHLMVRDRAGLELAQRISGGRASLAPDAAFGLRLRRPSTGNLDILLLLRRDLESAQTRQLQQDLLKDLRWRCVDWSPDPFGSNPNSGRLGAALRRRRRKARRRLLTAASARRLTAGHATKRRDHMAERRLEGGIELLAQGKVVITDRLHGHILCLLAGIPHVFLDNSYGKVSAFAETWGTVGDRSRTAQSLEEAVELSRKLLTEQ